MESQEKKNSTYLKQGGILAAASLIVRFIGMIYRIPMSNILGEEGNGIYAVAFEIYDLMLLISSYSLPLALSKIMSAQRAKRQYKNVGRTFKVAMTFALVSGSLFCLILLAGAGFIEDNIYPEYVGVQIPLRILAPTVFIVALLGVFRGFFQGKKTMVPTAFSQIVEQIINAIVSVGASFLFMVWHAGEIQQAAWGAAGGTLGTCLGAASALLVLIFLFYVYRPAKLRLEKKDKKGEMYSSSFILKILLATIIPIILSQTVYNISGLIDYKIFGSLSTNQGIDAVTIKSMVGVYSSKYRLLCGVPIAISTAVASSMVPSAVAAFTKRDLNQWKANVASGVKFNMLIAIPCAFAFSVVGIPIVHLLFASSNYILGGRMLIVGSSAIVFYAMSNVTGGALQSINKMRIPVINSVISLIVHIIIVYLCISFTSFGIYALIIGNITFPMVIAFLNFRAIKRYVPDYKQEITKTFMVPIAASVWMAVVIGIAFWIMNFITNSDLIRVIVAICLGIPVYFSLFILLKGISKEELFDFPMGRTLYTIARKMRLMK